MLSIFGTLVQSWLWNSQLNPAVLLCRPLYVTVVYQGKCSHCMRVGVAVPLSGTVSRLRQAVAQETKIPAQQVRPHLKLSSLCSCWQTRISNLVFVGFLIPRHCLDCSHWNVLRWLSSLLLRRWRRPRDHSGEWLHLCFWDTRAVQTGADPLQAMWYDILFTHSLSQCSGLTKTGKMFHFWEGKAACWIDFWKHFTREHVGFFPPTWTFSVYISGSPHANLNQNNLKYGTDNNRMATQIQEPTTPPQSPNKNSGQAEKIVLLVCNRACAGQQGRRCFNGQSCVRIANLIHKSSKTCCFSISYRFGNPFILYLERTVTWDVLQKEILEKMRRVLRPGVFVQVHIKT